MKKNNNVYGVFGIGVVNGNYNASFDKMPKSTELGEYATAQCFQFAVRDQISKLGEEVFYKKTQKKDGTLSNIKEKYEFLFGKEKSKDLINVRNNILNTKDSLMFGCVYTGANSFGIQGIIQIEMGYNKYKNTNIYEENILCPFVNSKKEGAETTTLGSHVFTDEAHYLHSFTFSHNEYDKYINDTFKGFTEDDFKLFKKASLKGVSCYNSKAKSGCKNEFGLFVELKEGEEHNLDLNGLDRYIEVYKEDGTIIYNIEKLKEILESCKNKIKDVEVYYNPYTLKLSNKLELDNCKYINIITMQEM